MLAMIFDLLKNYLSFFFLITDFWLLLKNTNKWHYLASIPNWNATKPTGTNKNATSPSSFYHSPPLYHLLSSLFNFFMLPPGPNGI